MCTEAWRGLISAGPAGRQGGKLREKCGIWDLGQEPSSLDWALAGSGNAERRGQDHPQAEIRVAGQGSLKGGGAADTIREVGLAAVCEHALEMEMSDGCFQEQSCPGTGWGEVSPLLLHLPSAGHAPKGRGQRKGMRAEPWGKALLGLSAAGVWPLFTRSRKRNTRDGGLGEEEKKN